MYSFYGQYIRLIEPLNCYVLFSLYVIYIILRNTLFYLIPLLGNNSGGLSFHLFVLFLINSEQGGTVSSLNLANDPTVKSGPDIYSAQRQRPITRADAKVPNGGSTKRVVRFQDVLIHQMFWIPCNTSSV